MRDRIRFFSIALAVAGLAVIPACNGSGGSSGSGGKIRIAIVTNNPDNWWNICEAGARKAEAELKNVEVDFRRPSPPNAGEQKKIIDALVSSGVKGIAISVIDPDNQTEYLNSISERVPVITQDNDAPKSKRVCYVGTDNYTAGIAVGELVKEVMPEGGTIVVCVGQIEPLNARERYQGTLDGITGKNDTKPSELGKYKLYNNEPITDGKDDKVALEKAKTAIAALKGEANVCMIGLWAYNTPAILTAAKGEGLQKKIKIVGFDENVTTLQGVQDGDIYATVVQDPFNFGYLSVKHLVDIHNGKKDEIAKKPLQYAPHRIITQNGGNGREAAKDFAKKLDEMMKPKG